MPTPIAASRTSRDECLARDRHPVDGSTTGTCASCALRMSTGSSQSIERVPETADSRAPARALLAAKSFGLDQSAEADACAARSERLVLPPGTSKSRMPSVPPRAMPWSRSVSPRHASPGSFTMNQAPPSAVVMFLFGWKLKETKSPQEPTACPSELGPIASAASSITRRLLAFVPQQLDPGRSAAARRDYRPE